jgi:serine/threonine protein kinase
MRLVDLITRLRTQTSAWLNVVRHPDAAARRLATKKGQEFIETTKIPGTEEKPSDQRRIESAQRSVESANRPPVQAPLSGTTPTAVAIGPRQDETASPSPDPIDAFFDDSFETWSEEPEPDRLPLLEEGTPLQGGWWGRYQVQRWVQNRGWFRHYNGLQENTQEPVWIFEYLLPETTFSLREAEARQSAFRQLINQNLGLGSNADFRLVKIKDVISDGATKRRCFLIVQPFLEAQTLAAYLETEGPMPAAQVRQVLFQVLQSLRYLHSTYRVRWLNENSERGLVHGNLNLDSLWIREDSPGRQYFKNPFFIYLSRFALWEHLFWGADRHHSVTSLAEHSQDLGSFKADLAALGVVGFQLLTGRQRVVQSGSSNDPELPDPLVPSAWPQTPEALALKPFILQLMGLQEPRFESADAALAALQRLSPVPEPEAPAEPVEPVPIPSPANDTIPIWAWLGLGLGIATLYGIWSIVTDRNPGPGIAFPPICQDDCRISDITKPQGSNVLTYGLETSSAWTSAFFYFINESSEPLPAEVLNQRGGADSPMHQLLSQRMQWTLLRPGKFVGHNVPQLIDQVHQGGLDVALVQGNIEDVGENLESNIVAYDGIVPVVVFSDGYQMESVPHLLKGKITLNDLGQLFSGQESSLSYPVKLYFPESDATVELFEAQLMAEGYLPTPEARAEFARLRAEDLEEIRRNKLSGEPANIYERMLVDFENQEGDQPVIGIGFDRLSRLFGQCSVYPLAVQHRGRTYSPLVEASGEPISPDTDLCGDKGSYWVNSDVFTNNGYPLGYGLSVVYRTCADEDALCNNGAAFNAMLMTQEGQYLLSEVGLVPLQPVNELRRILWANND